MDDRYEFERSLAEAARAMSEEDATHTLEHAVQMATDLLEPCDFAGISVVGPSGIETPAATDEALRRIDELQFELDEGPCLDSVRQSEVVVAVDLAEDPRWPTWGPHISSELDVHSAMSIRLFTSEKNLGVLNCYARHADAFGHEDVLDGLLVAAHAAVALAQTLEEDQFHRALDSRRMIGEATGILRERFGLTSEQAFAVLRRMSQTNNIKLHQVARTLCDTGALPGFTRNREKRPGRSGDG